MKTTFVFRDGQLVSKQTGEPLVTPKEFVGIARPQVASDWAPVRSCIDGKIYDGRTAYTEHLRRHGCVIVGNDMPPSRYGGPGGYIGD